MKFLWNTSSRRSEWCLRTRLQQWCRFWNSREFSSQGIWSARLEWFGMWFGPIKKASQILVSTLNEKNVLGQGVKVSFSWTRESPFLQYFWGDSSFVFCHNIPGLLKELELSIYNPNEWQMFFGNSKQNLKCVLQRNSNLFGAAPIGHSVCLFEENGDVKRVIELFQYDNRKWITFADLKMACFLFGQQRGYTKYLCILCKWDSRDWEKYWVETNWSPRSDLKPGDRNILHEPLVDRKKKIFLSLHIKLCHMKQFVKALPTDGGCFKCIILQFPGVSVEKIKDGVFDGPQIRQVIKDKQFTEAKSDLKKITIGELQSAWLHP